MACLAALGQGVDGDEIETVIVRADASINRFGSAHYAVESLTSSEVEQLNSQHASETFSRVPGVWVTRNSGHEHLTGVRSGVLTGPGACGSVLLLENGIPVRPQGFCNVNGLMEVNSEQAQRIEVVRGPASSRYGGNALHGMINVVTIVRPSPSTVDVTFGPDDLWQLRFRRGFDQSLGSLSFISNSNNGFRNHTGLSQQKLNLFHGMSRSNDWNVYQSF